MHLIGFRKDRLEAVFVFAGSFRECPLLDRERIHAIAARVYERVSCSELHAGRIKKPGWSGYLPGSQ